MVTKLSEIQHLPSFLKEYLSIGDGTVFGSDSVNYFLCANENWSRVWEGDKMTIFHEVYKLLKDRLGLRFREIENSNDKLLINSEDEFLGYEITELLYFSFAVIMDCPIYWYNAQTKELGKSILENGVRISFNSLNTLAGASPFSMSISFYYNLFSNDIATWISHGSVKPHLVYFEPAAILNRLSLRSSFLEIKARIPNIVVEFSTDEGRVFPRDEFGFLEGAKIVMGKEE